MAAIYLFIYFWHSNDTDVCCQLFVRTWRVLAQLLFLLSHLTLEGPVSGRGKVSWGGSLVGQFPGGLSWWSPQGDMGVFCVRFLFQIALPTP